MPRRDDLKKIMVIGSGPIVIGQACEFDYSGTQAIKALKQENYQVVLVNSNPATIMTDPDLADAVYIEPITESYLEKIIATEKPDAILPTVGGQTALNAALNLHKVGILEKYGVELIGAKAEAIEKAEDRNKFKIAMEKIGAKVPLSGFAHNMQEAEELRKKIGFPIILRPSFTLGGTGGGICYNQQDFETMAAKAIYESPINQVLIEQSVLGWKEFELEVMRDLSDNVVIICSIENLDAMGVHTGDSITVAPQQTLTDKEYQYLRDLSVKIIREIGVETGGSNIQFAVNPANGDVIVIEMNPRVSRSSALASKATGFPIAKIAAKLSVGYRLHEIQNDITQKTPASFEPSIDYIVTKIPRFTFEKFPDSPRSLDTQMRSVGEAMAIGRTFGESFQKAVRSLETGRSGWGLDEEVSYSIEIEQERRQGTVKKFLRDRLANPTDHRLFYLRAAFEEGMTTEEIYSSSHIDLWFLYQFERMIKLEQEALAQIKKSGDIDAFTFKKLKQWGYADKQIAWLYQYDPLKEMIAKLSTLEKGSTEFLSLQAKYNYTLNSAEKQVIVQRLNLGFKPVFKRVDTCAAEFESHTPYLYSSYEEEDESETTTQKKAIILGGGPNRIGQGIEFDYCCCHSSFALREMGIESIMVNSNPETVSTDYDISSRLYFEPLVMENIRAIIENERSKGDFAGVILQFGGQTPLKLAKALEADGIPILGTSPASIDRSEDREQFNQLISKLNLRQPQGKMASSLEQALTAAEDIGYPVLVRPSFVLGGRAMLIVHNEKQLRRYMSESTEVSEDRPILIDQFLPNATEIDVDALCDQNEVFICGILEHIEEAGVHSGDSACILPPKNITPGLMEEIRETTRKLALELEVKGCINIQYAIFKNELYVIEVNPRASRTVPFISKAIGIPLAKMATRIALGDSLSKLGLTKEISLDRFFVKEVVLPFKKFRDADTILGPEMKSTGEVMGIGKTPGEAFFKAQEAVGNSLPLSGNMFLSVSDESKELILTEVAKLRGYPINIIATTGTASAIEKLGIQVTRVNKVHEGHPHIVDLIKSKEIQFIINIPTDVVTRDDAFEIRMAALQYNVPYMTTTTAAIEGLKGLREMQNQEISIYPVESKDVTV